jgi:signal transduction histidine kinase
VIAGIEGRYVGAGVGTARGVGRDGGECGEAQSPAHLLGGVHQTRGPPRFLLGEEPDLPLETKETLYRIAQEALDNAVKLARASRSDLGLACEAPGITLEISDDGAGFDPDGDFSGHLGLKSMRECAARLGGTLRVESASGEGTTIRVQIPPVA